MTRRAIFIFSFLILAVVTAGFFIGSKILAAEEQLLFHDGNLSTISQWLCADCLQKESSGNYFLVASSSNFQLVSPKINLSGYTEAKFIFKARTYYGTTTTHYQINLLISEDNGSNWSLLTTTYPLNNSLNIIEWDLADYLGKEVAIKLSTPGVVGRNSVGLDDLYFQVVSVSTNQPPTAVATSSQTVAQINEDIFFNGTDSYDTDGTIIDWLWDLAGDLVHASTVTRSFSTTGTKPIYFWAIDNNNVTSSPVFFNLEIIDSSTSTATTTVTTTPVQTINPNDLVINEIYPAPPTGEAEWLELYNNTTSTIDLDGLYLLDAKAAVTNLTGSINAGDYLVIESINGNLNNDGDTIILRDTSQIISQTTYGDFSSKRDQSWARTTAGNYEATIKITRGSVNIIEAKPVSSSGGGSTVAQSLTQTATTSLATTTASTSTVAVDYRGKLIINEILPNPAGSDDEEFIELKNISDLEIELNGFYLADNTNSKHVIKSAEKIIVMAGGLVVIKRASSTIALNNSGFESVNLYDMEGELIDRITYQAEKSEGKSYSRTETGEWLWTADITPGEENIFDNQSEIIAAATAIVSKAKATAKKSVLTYGLVELENVPTLPDGANVIVRGVVAVEPGILGSQVFYIAGSGLQVYSYKKDFPSLKIGDYIEVKGELSTASTGRRLKTKTQADFKILEQREPPLAHQLKISEISEDYENNLVAVEGEIIEIKGRNIFLAEGDDELTVYLKTGIEIKDLNLKEGDLISVIGILVKSKNDYQLLPRNISDFKVISGAVKGEFEVSDSVNQNPINYYLLAIIVFLIAVILFIVVKKNKNKNSPT